MGKKGLIVLMVALILIAVGIWWYFTFYRKKSNVTLSKQTLTSGTTTLPTLPQNGFVRIDANKVPSKLKNIVQNLNNLNSSANNPSPFTHTQSAGITRPIILSQQNNGLRSLF